MTALFIANTTKQGHDFIFRMPENKQTTKLHIPAGHQMKVLNDGSADDIDYVIGQHAKYGLVSQEEASKAKGRYIGFIYSQKDPVRIKNMEIVYKHNDEELRKLAERNLAAQGLAVKENLDKIQREGGGRGTVRRAELEILEESKPGGKPAEVALGTEVPGQGVAPRAGRNRRNVGGKQ